MAEIPPLRELIAPSACSIRGLVARGHHKGSEMREAGACWHGHVDSAPALNMGLTSRTLHSVFCNLRMFFLLMSVS